MSSARSALGLASSEERFDSWDVRGVAESLLVVASRPPRALVATVDPLDQG